MSVQENAGIVMRDDANNTSQIGGNYNDIGHLVERGNRQHTRIKV